ncbi:hypothetical protein H257_02896 [Aphanomyces astaci]|uniref:Uncharacterized protein n=1 Tax=Aphanomyces astaci TaxID=112090 RepID=W4H1H2_APHAT|nr:hypothetical protein H257_02896 [Aphanomyces astaci]ETV85003.1 hypothetical protein H257_02896 [Aphanomyces astaci]|eukprot:XP_009825021.1 hypothetical protein H257_02896 [Aphanomyces astaci]
MTTELDAAIAFVAKARPRALTVGEKLDIIRLQAHFCKPEIKDVSNHVATILGRSNKTIQTVWSQYCNDGTFNVAKTRSNKSTHATRVPGTQAVMTLVLDLLRTKRLTNSRVVVRDVMELLCEHGHLDVEKENPTDQRPSLRATQTFFKRRGFMRRKKKGLDIYMKLVVHALQEDTPRTIIYLDESFIHHKYKLQHCFRSRRYPDGNLLRRPN